MGRQTYAAPVTTAAPVSYAAPMQTYAAPVTTARAAPMQTYAAPMQTYAAPMSYATAAPLSYGNIGYGAYDATPMAAFGGVVGADRNFDGIPDVLEGLPA